MLPKSNVANNVECFASRTLSASHTSEYDKQVYEPEERKRVASLGTFASPIASSLPRLAAWTLEVGMGDTYPDACADQASVQPERDGVRTSGPVVYAAWMEQLRSM